MVLVVALLGFTTLLARADHGEWQSRQVWVEPVVEERTRTIPGRWVKERVWIAPQTVTEEVTTTVPVTVEYDVFVADGHWDFVHVWVEAHEIQCQTVWQWYEDCSDFWGPCTLVYGPREECKRVDISYFELQQRWVDTSYWETRTRTEYQQQTQTVERTIPGRWETRDRWRPERTETYQHEVEPGRWETTLVWVEIPHEDAGPIEEPEGCSPAGIYKVSSNYAGNTQWTDSDGTIHYGTETSSDPNPWWAVSLGSVSKGAASSYDALAFNGRGSGADGLLLAGRFYRNYLPNGDCFDPVSVVFFQDDSVVSGDLDQQVEPEPAPGQEPDPADEPTIEPTPNPDPTPAPSPSPNPTARPDPTHTATPDPPNDPLPALDPEGEFAFTVVVEGSGAVLGTGQSSIQVLRGAPVEVYLLPRLRPPSGDPAAGVAFVSWRYLSGPNDHPGAPTAGVGQDPLQPLRLRLDSRPPTGSGRHRIELSARVLVVGSDGRTQSFDLPVGLLAGVHYQAIA